VHVRRMVSARQTLMVRPQPVRVLRLLQKTRRARTAFSLGRVALAVVPAQIAMPNERTNEPAVWTSRQLESLSDGVPIVVGAVKPAIFGHGRTKPPENRDCSASLRRGVAAGSDQDHWSGVPDRSTGPSRPSVCQIGGATQAGRSDGNSATFTRKCDQSGVRDSHSRQRVQPKPCASQGPRRSLRSASSAAPSKHPHTCHVRRVAPGRTG
jgi:hypothetical protein